ncbi:dTMP kinase (plasmid) [Pontibacillus sp. ALD_SL1]|uniref:dTMP kinase n=1 Tax=Pontibacillus sp. ALD_SL1 TaxID=2777185 RepID=UPI001A95B3A8|nr:dTMP kinase [Pontibacillus sp. ALD_SL1]QST02920.1 dTMP kinase [Pontibacillus sp. ALD_SL1]
MHKKPFILFNGGDGSGKGVQKERVASLVGEYVSVREPGGTKEAEIIRDILLSTTHREEDREECFHILFESPLHTLTHTYLTHAYNEIRRNGLNGAAEVYLYAASRNESNKNVVQKARRDGRIILGDRSVACSMAYQAGSRGMGADWVWSVNEPTLDGAFPDLELFLDVPTSVAQKRLEARTEKRDRLDLESLSFHEKAREGYLTYYKTYCPYPYAIVPADGTIEDVHSTIMDVLRSSNLYDSLIEKGED